MSIAGIVLAVQLVHPAFIAESGKVGTLYIVAFTALTLGFWLFARRRPIILSRAHGWSLLLWVLLLVSSFQAVNQGWSILWVAIAGVYLLVFFLLTNIAWSRQEFTEQLVDALLLIGLLAALLGLYEYVLYFTCGPSQLPLLTYVLPPDANPRVAGPIGQSNLFAMFLTVVLLAYFYRFLHGKKVTCWRWVNRLRFLPILIVGTVFFLTYSRGGLVSLAVVIGILTWLVTSGRYLDGNREGRREFFLLLACLGLCFVLSQVNLYEPSHSLGGASRLISAESGSNTNTSGRFVFWMSAILIFLDHPWLGVGLDNYRFLMNGYGPSSHKVLGFVEFEAMKPSFWAHNEYLQLMCEGGVLVFALILIFLIVFILKFWRNILRAGCGDRSLFLYSHLFVVPFLIQSSFEWPLRHPALLLLFAALAGILVSQYPLKEVMPSAKVRVGIVGALVFGLAMTGFLYRQELRIMDFRKTWLVRPIETTLDDLTKLSAQPYTSYRILRNTMPRYVNAAVRDQRGILVNSIIPYSERLASLEGTPSQWYDLARLYLRADRLEDARIAVRKAFELKPTDPVVFDLMHHLNVLKNSRATGRPVEYFYPSWIPVKNNFQDLKND